METLKNWLFLIGHKSAVNLFLIFVYGSLLILISFIGAHVYWEAHYSPQGLTHVESLAWLFIITITSLLYVSIIFIAKAKLSNVFICFNAIGLLLFYFTLHSKLENYYSDSNTPNHLEALTTYNTGVLSLFIAIIVTLIFFKKYHFTFQQRFLRTIRTNG